MKLRRLLVLAAATALPACSGTSPDLAPGQVNVSDYLFSPRTASPDTNGVVTWYWVGFDDHNLVFADGIGSLTTPQSSGQHQRDFSSDPPGTYAYECTRHQGMNGSVVVP